MTLQPRVDDMKLAGYQGIIGNVLRLGAAGEMRAMTGARFIVAPTAAAPAGSSGAAESGDGRHGYATEATAADAR